MKRRITATSKNNMLIDGEHNRFIRGEQLAPKVTCSGMLQG
jgi:hypothetical protein